jgi:hypothetical protein
MLIHLYAVSTWGETSKEDPEAPRTNGLANGHTRAVDHRRVRDAEEFELAGLMSDDEDPESPVTAKTRHEG